MIKDLIFVSSIVLDSGIIVLKLFVRMWIFVVGLNFRDVLNILDMYFGVIELLGIDFLGIIDDVYFYLYGDVIFGLTIGCFGDVVYVYCLLFSIKLL